ncbi:MAG: Bro-N domain-containing protein [Euryarchaeota archaeon]|nr:Bro-N domain-containing protein [Euryarchaeota archaeon]
MENKIIVFQDRKIRRTWFNDEWWFSVSDVVEALTDSADVKQYIKKMRSRDLELNSYWGTICTPLEMIANDGKKRKLSSANTEGVFRIIQSIPSPKAEPFKRWLAHVGYERVQEIENPELAQERVKQIYTQKGYSKSWIDKRLRGIAIRQDLTDEWQERGITTQRDFSILTAEISKASFGMTPSEYKELKGLKKENLRDHMTDLELIFSMLGEASTTEIERTKNPKKFAEHKRASKEGGTVAKNARLELEQKAGKKIIMSGNYLKEPEKKKRLGGK